MKKKLKKISSDRQGEAYLEEDLSDYLHLGNFRKVSFEIQPKDKAVTLRMPNQLVEAFKSKAEKDGVNYQKLMRQALEKFIKRSAS